MDLLLSNIFFQDIENKTIEHVFVYRYYNLFENRYIIMIHLFYLQNNTKLLVYYGCFFFYPKPNVNLKCQVSLPFVVIFRSVTIVLSDITTKKVNSCSQIKTTEMYDIVLYNTGSRKLDFDGCVTRVTLLYFIHIK